MHFEGMGSLLRLKLAPQIARKMLLEAHKWTGKEALADGIVDQTARPEEMLDVALDLANKWAPKAKAGVYGVLRGELYGEASRAFALISHVHSRETNRRALVKL
jgi:enoyl-CoA hydratase/carnithine racemase